MTTEQTSDKDVSVHLVWGSPICATTGYLQKLRIDFRSAEIIHEPDIKKRKLLNLFY